MMLLSAAASVCVVLAGAHADATRRLEPLAGSVRLVELPERLDGCEVVVLGSGWAQIGDGSWEWMEPQLPALERFVRGGGGLLVFQPNPHGHPEERLTIDLVGAPVTFENWYRGGEDVRTVRAHALTSGFEGGLPWPADRITTFDPRWTSLVRGRSSEDVSLLAGEFGCGRAVVDTDNPALTPGSNAKSHHSDDFLRAVLSWLRETPAGCRPDT